MKILTKEQIRAADAYTIANEPILSLKLMDRAAIRCAKWLKERFQRDTCFVILCGTGNNGGDGLAIAKELLLHEYRFKIKIFIVPFFSSESEDFAQNKIIIERRKRKKKESAVIKSPAEIDISSLTNEKIVIIDALLGSGLSKPLEGKLAEVIQKINSFNLPVISIDMPSGLSMEDNTSFDRKNIIRATHTLTFETPKLSFMFLENEKFIGQYHILDIGLDKQFIAEQETKNYWVTQDMITPLIRNRARFSHKGTYGHALLIAGSYGKMGAAVLGAKSCLRAGVGLITAHIPECGYDILQTSVPEAMVMTDEEEKEFSGIKDISKFNAIGIGPGIGLSENTANGLKMLIRQNTVPMVLDADALNILSENKTWLSFLKPGSIITPHPGEFARLAGKSDTGYEAYIKQRDFAIKYRLYVVLKGANTSIATPDGEVYFNSTGNPGMATGGSGDTLTGIILGLLAQGYTAKQAALLGVYLHGLAGDIAAKEWGENSMIASDITNYLGKAFEHLAH